MSIKDKIVSNATYLSLNWIAITLLPIFFWFIVGKTLPPESYGIIATSLQLAVFLSFIASLGLPMAISKLLPELLIRKQKSKIQGVINHSLKLTVAAIIVISIILAIFSQQLSNALKMEISVIFIIIAMFVFNTFGNLFKNFYYGLQNMRKIFSTNLIGQGLRVVVTLGMIFLGFSYFGALGGLLVSFFLIFITRVSKSLFTISKKVIVDKKLIYEYSVPSFIRMIFTTLFTNTQYIILSIFKTIQISGLYASAVTITSLVATVPQVVDTSLFPIISGLCADKDGRKKQAYLLRLIFRYSILIVLPIAVFLLIFPEYVITLVFNDSLGYLEAARFLILLIPAEFFNSLGVLSLSFIYAIGRPKDRRNTWIVTTLVYITLAIPLTYYFSGIGLAASYLVASVTFFGIGMYLIRKHIKFSLPSRDMAKVFVSSLALLSILLLSKTIIDSTSPYGMLVKYSVIAAISLAALLIYFLIVLLSGFLIEEDLTILDTLSGKVPMLKSYIIGLKTFLSRFVKKSYKAC